MQIIKMMCKLYRLLIYVFKEVTLQYLLEIWTIARALSILLIVAYIILGNTWINYIDGNILQMLK
jgi:hypothetical protein